MTDATPLEPLHIPADRDGWLRLAGADSDEGFARVRALDERLRTDKDLPPSERLALWDEAQRILGDALQRPYLFSESHPDAAVREAAEERVQAGEALIAERALDAALYEAMAATDASGLDPLEERLLSHVLRDFRRAGVDRDDATRERLRALAARDTELSLAFSRHIRDGRRELKVAPAALAGLPQDFVDAHPVGDDGLVTLTTEYPDLMPVREYARDRATRRALVGLYNDVAYPENDAVLAELLRVRAERADLLGYGDYADFETETRMVGSSANVRAFLDEVDEASAALADAEYARVLARLKVDDPDATEVTIADFWYVLGALKREEYAVDAQEVRAYFPFDAVRRGVLETTGRLLQIEYVPVDAASWHDEVTTYDVVRDGRRLGRIHLDLHPRDGKYSHAACFGLSTGVAGRALPEGVLLCNFSRGLLEHDEVVTFFHEFGHLVHGILGGADARFASFSGIETEWDFVEAPSQLLEEWAWDASVLQTFARNAAGESIPAELVERMRVADGFGRGLEVRRQLGHAQVSYHLHVDVPDDLQAATEHWYDATSPVTPLRGRHSYAGFGHLTGYGSCYYTYQWSLVIARDLLSAFRDGLMDEETALRYREAILEPGGSRDAADLVRAFLGRDYSVDAYRAWLRGGV